MAWTPEPTFYAITATAYGSPAVIGPFDEPEDAAAWIEANCPGARVDIKQMTSPNDVAAPRIARTAGEDV